VLGGRWNLGVDLDRKPMWKVLLVYYNMKYIYGSVRVYRTENGYHFEADVPTSIEARCGLGDDPKRLMLSELRSYCSGYLDDVLYDCKYDGKKWRSREEIDEWYLLADPFWHFPRMKRR